LQKCAEWWSQHVGLFKKYEKYLLINIANEWVSAFDFEIHFIKTYFETNTIKRVVGIFLPTTKYGATHTLRQLKQLEIADGGLH